MFSAVAKFILRFEKCIRSELPSVGLGRKCGVIRRSMEGLVWMRRAARAYEHFVEDNVPSGGEILH